MIAIKDKYLALSPQIVPWMYPSEFERYLAEEAGKSGIAKKYIQSIIVLWNLFITKRAWK